jgi:hypothetical protein
MLAILLVYFCVIIIITTSTLPAIDSRQMLTVMRDGRIQPIHGELVSIVAFTLELFNTLNGLFPGMMTSSPQ